MNSNKEDKAARNPIYSLISMIDDPDPEVYEKIFESITGFGSAAIPVLENVAENTFDPEVLERLQELIEKIHTEGIVNDLQRWKVSENHDLIQLLQILSKFHFRNIDMLALNDRIVALQREIWLELNEHLTSFECVRLVNHFMFRSWSISPANTGIFKPEHFFLNKILESRKVHPAILGTLYLGFSQRLTLPVFYVALPDNFILAYASQPRFNPSFDPGEALFYINPLLDGVIFNKIEIDRFLEINNMIPQPEYYQAFDNLRVAKLIIGLMRNLYQDEGNHLKKEAVNRMIQVFG
jgi:hypothetical protein